LQELDLFLLLLKLAMEGKIFWNCLVVISKLQLLIYSDNTYNTTFQYKLYSILVLVRILVVCRKKHKEHSVYLFFQIQYFCPGLFFIRLTIVVLKTNVEA